MKMGDIIKQLRLERGLTQEELGQVIGVQKSAIRKYESGLVQNIKRSNIKKLADYFGVTPSYLLGYAEIQDKPEPTPDTNEYSVAFFEGAKDLTDENRQKVEEFIDFLKSKQDK